MSGKDGHRGQMCDPARRPPNKERADVRSSPLRCNQHQNGGVRNKAGLRAAAVGLGKTVFVLAQDAFEVEGVSAHQDLAELKETNGPVRMNRWQSKDIARCEYRSIEILIPRQRAIDIDLLNAVIIKNNQDAALKLAPNWRHIGKPLDGTPFSRWFSKASGVSLSCYRKIL